MKTSAANIAHIQPGTIVRHQKRGTRYEVVTIGLLEKTCHEHVVYRSLDNGSVWIRPLVEFIGLAGGVPRFVVEKT